MPYLIFDVSKEYQTTMHAKVPSQQDHLAAKMQGVLDQLVYGEKQCTFVGFLNNLDASDNTEDKMCEFSRNRDRLVEGERENNTVNGSSSMSKINIHSVDAMTHFAPNQARITTYQHYVHP